MGVYRAVSVVCTIALASKLAPTESVIIRGSELAGEGAVRAQPWVVVIDGMDMSTTKRFVSVPQTAVTRLRNGTVLLTTGDLITM